MDHLSKKVAEDTAQLYEDMLVPAIFQEWAERLASIEEIRPYHHILDVACGTGVLTRALKKLLIKGSITGLDPNTGMLSIAKQKAPHINWYEGTAEDLPFNGKTFDVVMSQFGLMLFSSPKEGLLEMKRVLKPNGLMVISVFDSIEKMPAYLSMANIFEKTLGRPVGEVLRAPFSMGDTRKIELLFSEADLDIDITTQRGSAKFLSPRHMVFSDVKGWFPFADIHMEESTIESIVREAEVELQPFTTVEGALEFETSVHVIKARIK